MNNQDGLWAALDLGSNSFHLLLADVDAGRITTIERIKDKVQLLSGFEQGQIQSTAYERGLACLKRFSQRLNGLPEDRILVMGTAALRQATNSSDFLAQASQQLRVPISVISGEDEAQLIYRAVVEGARAQHTQQLVLDIGGGSTELCLGLDGEAQAALSVYVGCVAYKDDFFSVGQSSGYQAAKKAAAAALNEALSDRFEPLPRELDVVGTSGTIESVLMVLRANGWASDTITRGSMEQLEQAIVDERWVVEVGLPGLAPDRVDIFPSGVAILAACFEVLGLDELRYVDVSLLHGMLFQASGSRQFDGGENRLAGRSIDHLAQRFNVNVAQARRVRATALALFDDAMAWWEDDVDANRLWLQRAAELHELGMEINARHYHRHGAYIIKHAQIPGVEELERQIIALLVRGHRRSLPNLAFQAFNPTLAATLIRLVAILRIAVILERSHTDADSPEASLQIDGDTLTLDCTAGWLAAHPLSAKELGEEIKQLKTAGLSLILAD